MTGCICCKLVLTRGGKEYLTRMPNNDVRLVKSKFKYIFNCRVITSGEQKIGMEGYQMSDLIAIGAALIAGLAALYARWASISAQRANEIALHSERLKIYKSLLNHGSTLATRGVKFPENSLWSFHDAVQLSEFYFDPEVYKELDSILEDSFEILNLRGLWDITKGEGKNKFNDLVRACQLIT